MSVARFRSVASSEAIIGAAVYVTAQAVPSTIAATTSAPLRECTPAISAAAPAYTRQAPAISSCGGTARGNRSSSASAAAVGTAAAADNAP
nr:hypothetical protein [Candidatus Frankia alpina]